MQKRGHTMNIPIDQFASTFSEKVHNEDALYADDTLWIVADGASAIGPGDCMKTGSDAAWLSHALADAHEAFKNFTMPLEELVRQQLIQLKKNFPEDGISPSAAIAIARLNVERGKLETFVLGDCVILIETADGTIRISDDAVSHFDQKVIDRMVQISQSEGIPFLQTRQDERIRSMLAQNRSKKNTPYGYSIIDLNANWPSSLQSEVDIKDVHAIALFSDGFDQLQEFMHLDNDAFMKMTLEDPSRAMDFLYFFQEKDADCLQLPRLKKRDDTTLVCAEFLARSV